MTFERATVMIFAAVFFFLGGALSMVYVFPAKKMVNVSDRIAKKKVIGVCVTQSAKGLRCQTLTRRACDAMGGKWKRDKRVFCLGKDHVFTLRRDKKDGQTQVQ